MSTHTPSLDIRACYCCSSTAQTTTNIAVWPVLQARDNVLPELSDIRYLPPIVRYELKRQHASLPMSRPFHEVETGRKGELTVANTETGQLLSGTWTGTRKDDEYTGTWRVETEAYGNLIRPRRMQFTTRSTKYGTSRGIIEEGSGQPVSVLRSTPFGPVWLDPEGPKHKIQDQDKNDGYVVRDDTGGGGRYTTDGGRIIWSWEPASEYASRARWVHCPTHKDHVIDCGDHVSKEQIVYRGHVWDPENDTLKIVTTEVNGSDKGSCGA